MKAVLEAVVLLGALLGMVQVQTLAVQTHRQIDRLLALRERVRFHGLDASTSHCSMLRTIAPECSLDLRSQGKWLSVCEIARIGQHRNRWWRIVCPVPKSSFLLRKMGRIEVSFKT